MSGWRLPVPLGVRGKWKTAFAAAAWLDARPGLALLLSAIAAAILLGGMAILVALAPHPDQRLAIDYRQYVDATDRWLAGGSFYQPWQLSAEYTIPQDEFRIDRLPVLYPPYALVLFVPFALFPALAVLWWVLPLAAIAASVARNRPRPAAWPILALCACHGDTIWLTLSGNPVLWVAAFSALGIWLGWPSIGVLIKPSLAPLAFIGSRRTSWWIAFAAFALVAIAFLGLWPDYLTALGNLRAIDARYPFVNLPILLIPIVARLGRRPISSAA